MASIPFRPQMKAARLAPETIVSNRLPLPKAAAGLTRPRGADLTPPADLQHRCCCPAHRG